MEISSHDTAVVCIDPQADVLSPLGRAPSPAPDRWISTGSPVPAPTGITKVILGGMLANMCVEPHRRDLLEQGFEVAVVADATAGPRHPERGDGYAAAMANYRYLAQAVLSTAAVVAAMR